MLAALACLAGALACEDGSRGRPGTPGAPAPALPTPTTVAPRDDAPALQVEILGLSGASGPGGAFRTGDRVRVRFRMEQRAGTPWLVSEMTSGKGLVSGPTCSYRRDVQLHVPAPAGRLRRPLQRHAGVRPRRG